MDKGIKIHHTTLYSKKHMRFFAETCMIELMTVRNEGEIPTITGDNVRRIRAILRDKL